MAGQTKTEEVEEVLNFDFSTQDSEEVEEIQKEDGDIRSIHKEEAKYKKKKEQKKKKEDTHTTTVTFSKKNHKLLKEYIMLEYLINDKEPKQNDIIENLLGKHLPKMIKKLQSQYHSDD